MPLPFLPSRENSRTAASRENSRTAASLSDQEWIDSGDTLRSVRAALPGQAGQAGQGGQGGQQGSLNSSPPRLSLIGRIVSCTTGNTVQEDGEHPSASFYDAGDSGYEVHGYDARGHEVEYPHGPTVQYHVEEGEEEDVEGRGDIEARRQQHFSGELHPDSAVCTVFTSSMDASAGYASDSRTTRLKPVRSTSALLADDGMVVSEEEASAGVARAHPVLPVSAHHAAGEVPGASQELGYMSDSRTRASGVPRPNLGIPMQVHATPSGASGTNTNTTHSHTHWPSPSSAESAEEIDELPDWEPPVPCPLQNGGYPHLKMGALTHYYLMAPICLLAVTGGIVYLGWKAFTIFSNLHNTGPTAIIFLTTEWLLFLSSLMLMLEISRPGRDRPALMIPPTGPFPLTNIFICCCKEPVDIIQDTVKGAMHQIYPYNRYTVWVLDDGGDEELRKWVEAEAGEKYGHDRLRYLRRHKKKGVPHHFKAGNINHGLNHASGEFVAILDADMIPSPYFLTSLLPHFSSEKIAFVQCPQSFYNAVRGDPLNDTSRDFYDVLLPYRDGRDSAQCVGTGAIFRMSCLRQNGGFTCGTITEDFDTALSLHSRGYDSVYVNQKLQAGLAAWTFEAYVKQHQRWATGSLQLLFQRKPLLIKDKRFSLYRRVSYWWAGVQYYMNLVAVLVLVQPLIIVAFNLPIMPENSPPSVTRRYIILLVPYMVFARIASVMLSARFKDSGAIMLRSEQPWYWMAYYNCTAIFKFFFPLISKQFEATGAKKVVHRSVLSRLPVVWFHLVFIAAGVGISAWQLATLDYHDCGKLLKVCGWTPAILYTCQVMMVPVWHVLLSRWHPKPEKRREYINYTPDGVPYFSAEQSRAPRDWRLVFFHIIPVLWFIIIFFFFYCAVTDYAPPFCNQGGFFGYDRF